jgi:dephospho-CoA kinase
MVFWHQCDGMHEEFKAIPVTLVGLTGGIGAGKSTITDHLRFLGIPVFDCDAAVKGYYADPSVVQALTEEFGEQGDDPKATMAKMAWDDPAVRKRLEEIFTQRILQDFWDFKSKVAEEYKGGDRPIAVLDAPTLFEHHMEDLVDLIVSVVAPMDHRRARVANRPDMTDEKIDAVIAAQTTDAHRMARSHFCIYNTDSIEALRFAASSVFDEIMESVNGKAS